ncbi:MAG TPA: HPr family phosphocarrier protein [Pyrinomonadaceae bacterium]|nr:HPr family phosphocarrier protein [Pyrinomonadaceae bacterium]
MLRSTVMVSNRLGLHARAAAQLVRLASTFESSIMLSRTDTTATANARSILNVLTLAAVQGTTLEITAEGDDEADALNAVKGLFTSGFGEE